MKIFITGSKGQLGSELLETLLATNEHIIVGHDRDTLDITSYDQLIEVVSQEKPDVIINTAAYTNVDGCESDYSGAYAVNVIGAMNVARAAHAVNAKVLHISTDFVFDGAGTKPYFEYDATNPLSVYGKTKLAGEWAIRNECKNHFIVRTSWLYGKNGNNFVKTMIKLGKTNKELSVVTDQVGCPTYVTDLVEAIRMMIDSDHYGTYHFSNYGSCSWNTFAKKIFEYMDMNILVKDTTSKEFVRPAQRPNYSVMDTLMISKSFGVTIRPWEESLETFINSQRNILMAD